MSEEDDTHDLLVKAFLEYFKANEAFEQRPGELKRRKARKWLTYIRKLALTRKEEIIKSHLEKFPDGRINNWKNTRLARQKRGWQNKSTDT